ncbi:MAG: response regulator [Deltaproteobacteria bacterium]|nr:response regulator [Deltaproteobacteria bacterium]MBN2672231.1 response regulator [Deltaproteobacteria bacterium]
MKTSVSVLVVDDDMSMRELCRSMLYPKGWQSQGAETAEEAKRLLQGDARFDVMVCDLVMPGNEDMIFVKWVYKQFPTLPMVIITGQPSFDSAIESVRLAVVDYLVKPFSKEAFLNAVSRAAARGDVGTVISHAGENIRKWSDEVDVICNDISRDGANSKDALQSYFHMTLKNMAGCIADLQNAALLASTQANPCEKGPCRYFNCTRFTKNVAIVQDAISVLESTRKSFKSKELQQLRERLQDALDEMVTP